MLTGCAGSGSSSGLANTRWLLLQPTHARVRLSMTRLQLELAALSVACGWCLDSLQSGTVELRSPPAGPEQRSVGGNRAGALTVSPVPCGQLQRHTASHTFLSLPEIRASTSGCYDLAAGGQAFLRGLRGLLKTPRRLSYLLTGMATRPDFNLRCEQGRLPNAAVKYDGAMGVKTLCAFLSLICWLTHAETSGTHPPLEAGLNELETGLTTDLE